MLLMKHHQRESRQVMEDQYFGKCGNCAAQQFLLRYFQN